MGESMFLEAILHVIFEDLPACIAHVVYHGMIYRIA